MNEREKQILDIIGGKRIKITLYMLENSNSEKTYIGSYKKIAADTETTITTVMNVISFLIKENVIKKIQNAVYQFII